MISLLYTGVHEIDWELTGRSFTAAIDTGRWRSVQERVFNWRCGSCAEPMLTHRSATLGGPFLVGAAPLGQGGAIAQGDGHLVVAIQNLSSAFLTDAAGSSD